MHIVQHGHHGSISSMMPYVLPFPCAEYCYLYTVSQQRKNLQHFSYNLSKRYLVLVIFWQNCYLESR